MKNVLTPLAKSILVPLVNGSSASNRCSYSEESFWFRYDSINNFKKMDNIMKIIKSPEELGLLLKGVSSKKQ